MNNQRAVNILLVEDNPGDAHLTSEAFRSSKVAVNLHIVENGEEAMQFLYKQIQYTNASCPDIVILDLNLPCESGHEVLKLIKLDDVLKLIPVIILTTSDNSDDILKSYELHANCYITKPAQLDEFIRVVKEICDFWISIVTLPHLKPNEHMVVQ